MTKTCSVCGDPIPQGNRSGRCKKCYQKHYHKSYKDSNKEFIKIYQKVWREANPDKNRAYQKRWREHHPEKDKAVKKKYRDDNQEREKARHKKYRDDNPDKVRGWRHERRKYLSSPKDCEKLNEWFPDSVGHHLEPDVMVYIPGYLHRSIFHNIRTGQGMEEINRVAFDWLNDVHRASTQTTLAVFR